MGKKKKVNEILVGVTAVVAKRKALAELPDFLDKLPVDADGVEIDYDEVEAALLRTFDWAEEELNAMGFESDIDDITQDVIDSFLGVEEEPEQEGDMYGHQYHQKISRDGRISIDGIWRDKYTFPGKGPDYGNTITFVFPDGGYVFNVRNTSARGWGPAGMKFQPGGGLGTTPGMELYHSIGRKAPYVDMYFSKDPGYDNNEYNTGEVETEPIDRFKTQEIPWGGDQNDPDHDRTWWSKPHGGDYEYWHRKFPLERWIDDEPHGFTAIFSDGNRLKVPNSKKMAMGPGSSKYRPQDAGERDPRKMHPKVVAPKDSRADSVRIVFDR